MSPILLVAGLLVGSPSLVAVSPMETAQAASPIRTYTASGNLTDAARARLTEAIKKVVGVEKVEFQAMLRSFTVRVTGDAKANDVSRAGISAGFDFRSAPTRTFAAAGSAEDAEVQRLREALGKVEGVEVAETAVTGKVVSARVQGHVKIAALLAAGKTAGYALSRALTYVASGSPLEADLSRLRKALAKTPGVDQIDLHGVGGGATLIVTGGMEDEALLASAASAGYQLKTLSSNAGTLMFEVAGVNGPQDEEKLRKAMQAIGGIGEFRVMALGDLVRLGVRGGTAGTDTIVAAAKAAGFDLQPAGRGPAQGVGNEGERDTPPAYDERVNDDLTRVGDAAPEFTLVTKDGSGKVSLSDFRGKKPVVLIFGSYT